MAVVGTFPKAKSAELLNNFYAGLVFASMRMATASSNENNSIISKFHTCVYGQKVNTLAGAGTVQTIPTRENIGHDQLVSLANAVFQTQVEATWLASIMLSPAKTPKHSKWLTTGMRRMGANGLFSEKNIAHSWLPGAK